MIDPSAHLGRATGMLIDPSAPSWVAPLGPQSVIALLIMMVARLHQLLKGSLWALMTAATILSSKPAFGTGLWWWP